MKFILPLLATLAAFSEANPTKDRGLVATATLQQKWRLDLPDPQGLVKDDRDFSLIYTISDFITAAKVDHTLYTSACKEGNVLVDGGISVHDGLTTETEGDGLSDRSDTVTFTIDPDAIAVSNVYSEGIVSKSDELLGTDVDHTVATIAFCHRMSLQSGSTEVNFFETTITITVDLTDTFAIDAISVTPRDRASKTADSQYCVVGYFCDPLDLTVPISLGTLNQGAVINVCVHPIMCEGDDQPDPQADGIYMRSLDTFTFTQDKDGDDIDDVTQGAISSGSSSDEMTEYDVANCQGVWTCLFSTILKADFFSVTGPPLTVNGKGVATMQFGTAPFSARRQLRSDARETQEDPGAGAAEFDLQFEVNPSASTSGASSRLGIVFISAVAALAAAAIRI